MLHVLNGDATRVGLEQAGVQGRIVVWGDVLYDGPVPHGVDDAAFRETRARFWAGRFISYGDALVMHERWDRGLASSEEEDDEVVLWFEHDLHDQILLARQLDWFARRQKRQHTLSLVCVGAFPGVVPFHGLGQLTPSQLASLLGSRQRVSARQLTLGQSTWRAFTGADPRAIERLLAHDTLPLPFLDGAMRRLLEEFPDARTGLSRTERSILQLLSAQGRMPFTELFSRQQQTEERVFMGDWTFWSRLYDLARGARALIRFDNSLGTNPDPLTALEITDDGRRVLTGEIDWMTIAIIDRWIGGSRLVAPKPAWRWDKLAERLVADTSLASWVGGSQE